MNPRPSGLFVGLATLDVVHVVDALPATNQKLDAGASWLAAGGPAANAAIAFAALGGNATLWTALGTGPAARLVAADLATAGVRVLDAAPPGFELAPSSVLVQAEGGDRAVVSGAAVVVPSSPPQATRTTLRPASTLGTKKPSRRSSRRTLISAG